MSLGLGSEQGRRGVLKNEARAGGSSSEAWLWKVRCFLRAKVQRTFWCLLQQHTWGACCLLGPYVFWGWDVVKVGAACLWYPEGPLWLISVGLAKAALHCCWIWVCYKFSTFPVVPPTPMPYPAVRKKSSLEFLSLLLEAQEGTLFPLQGNRPNHNSVCYPVEGLLCVVFLVEYLFLWCQWARVRALSPGVKAFSNVVSPAFALDQR